MPQKARHSYRNAPCICGSGVKQKNCHPDIHPDSRAGQVLKLYHQLDTLIDSYYKKASTALPPCQKGCASCCYNNFSISGIEFKLMTRELKTWNQEHIEELYAVTRQQWAILAQKHPEYICEENIEAETTLNQAVLIEQYSLRCTSHDLPCPLLDLKNGICRIYNSRPLICRLHGTTYYIPEDFKVCEKIPSNYQLSKIAVDATKIFYESTNFSQYMVNGRIYKSLRYPILYYLRLLFANWNATRAIMIPNEDRDFRLPSHIAAKLQIQKE